MHLLKESCMHQLRACVTNCKCILGTSINASLHGRDHRRRARRPTVCVRSCFNSQMELHRQGQEQPMAAHIQVELDLRLLKAAAAGNLERVQAAHTEGGDLAAVGLNGGLPLHFAAKGGHTGVCSYLLSHGAQIDATTAYEAGGFTALWIAAQYGREDVIAELVKGDAAVDRQAGDGSTALWIAAAKGNDAAVRTLLTCGASVHLCDHKGTSPLLVAAKFGQEAAAKALLAAGADYEQLSDLGVSPLDAALENGHSAVVRMLFAAARTKRDWALAEMRQCQCDVDALNQQITQRAEDMLSLRQQLQERSDEVNLLVEHCGRKDDRIQELERAVAVVAQAVLPLQSAPPLQPPLPPRPPPPSSERVSSGAAASMLPPPPQLPELPPTPTPGTGTALKRSVAPPPSSPAPPPQPASSLTDASSHNAIAGVMKSFKR